MCRLCEDEYGRALHRWQAKEERLGPVAGEPPDLEFLVAMRHGVGTTVEVPRLAVDAPADLPKGGAAYEVDREAMKLADEPFAKPDSARRRASEPA